MTAWWGWLGANEKQVTIVLAILAGLYAIFEYRNSVERDQIAEAMKLATSYTERLSKEPHQRLRTFWLTPEVSSWTAKLKADADKARKKKLYYDELPGKMSDALKFDAYDLLYFYRSVGYCTASGRCHPKTICQFFFQDVQGYRENYRPLIDNWKETTGESTGVVVKQLVEIRCKGEFEDYCRDKDTSVSPYCQREN